MGEGPQDVAMARRGTAQVVMLPRDPETAYVYWEWPGLGDGGATLTVYASGGVERHAVTSFEISQECGGRFVTFGPPGTTHTCVLDHGDEQRESASVTAPSRESGDETPSFARVELTDRGLRREPAEHDHAVHGRFPPAETSPPSSDAPTSSASSDALTRDPTSR